jgi:sulfite exporter TauE/SafE
MENHMGLGTSIFLIAVGAILDFAVDVNTQGLNLHAVGAILMVVGAIGVVLSLVFWSSWGGFRSNRGAIVERRVYEDELL